MTAHLKGWTLWLATAAAAAVAVGLVRWYALHRSILDHPNERSSHAQPVPRGGGLGLVAAFLLVGATAVHPLDGAGWGWALVMTCAIAVAVVGWMDDRRGMPVRLRLVIHIAAGVSLAVLASMLGEPPLWCAWWLFWAISSINVINFMDGIDGLVASQCLLLMLSIARLTPAGSASHALSLVLGGALAGFLTWNWPPARIFMGDVGSGTLGFLCATIGAVATLESGWSIVRVFLPLLPLFLDATWTFVRRLRNGERVTQAHRSHLYQRLANGGWGHRRTTLAYVVAAAIGVLVAQVPAGRAWVAAVVGYVVAALSVGVIWDRVAPFRWRDRSHSATT